MEHKSEVLKIIEAGMECDKSKLIAYASFLSGKCVGDEKFQKAIKDRVTGEYKKKPVLKF